MPNLPLCTISVAERFLIGLLKPILNGKNTARFLWLNSNKSSIILATPHCLSHGLLLPMLTTLTAERYTIGLKNWGLTSERAARFVGSTKRLSTKLLETLQYIGRKNAQKPKKECLKRSAKRSERAKFPNFAD
jgi:hypothetical protein